MATWNGLCNPGRPPASLFHNEMGLSLVLWAWQSLGKAHIALLLKEHVGKIPLLWAASLSFTPPAEIFLPYSTEEELFWGWNKLKMKSDSVPYMGNFSPLVPLCASLYIFLPWLRGLSIFTSRQPPTCHDPVPKVTFWFVLEPRMVVFGGWVPTSTQSLRFTVVITEPDPRGWECWYVNQHSNSNLLRQDDGWGFIEDGEYPIREVNGKVYVWSGGGIFKQEGMSLCRSVSGNVATKGSLWSESPSQGTLTLIIKVDAGCIREVQPGCPH